MTYQLALAATLAIVALLLTGAGAVRRGIRAAFAMPRLYAITLTVAVTTGLILLILARRYVEVREELVYLAASTVAFGSLLLIALHFQKGTRTAFEWLEAQSPARVAGLSLVFGVLAGVVVLQSFPHVSDEVAYQFQARALAGGQLYFPAPPVAEAVTFIHTFVDGGHWYGIMNPGWPAFLAAGYLAGLPWLINPVLGAITLLVFAGFLREAGMDRRTSRFAILFLVVSPFVIFMNGTFMSHTANLLLFAVFCWAWARLIRTGSIAAAVIAGVAVAWNLLVRPVDTAAVTFPFVVHGLIRMMQDRRLLAPVLLSGIIGLGGIAATMAYDRALTGDAMVMPVSRYFEARNPDEHFGIGFGDDMGTSIHGDEWPGFHLADAFRVTAHRLVQFTRDVYGLPLLILAIPCVAWWRRRDLSDEWTVLVIASAASLTIVYFFHFYHGIAYGSRHLYLVLPAVALLLGRFTARGTEEPESGRSALTRAAAVALVFYVFVFVLPPLVREYGDNYRGSSAIVRRAVEDAGLGRSLVFVEPGDWAWKSAFPLNEYPLETNQVLFVRDLPETRDEALAQWPNREVWSLTISGGQVHLEPLP